MTEETAPKGIVIQPWVAAVLITCAGWFLSAVYNQATTNTRVETLTLRVARIEQQIDSMAKLRSPAGYHSPPVTGFGGGPRLGP